MSRECLCGTEIPETGTGFDPGCRHCERVLVSRMVAQTDGVEHGDVDASLPDDA